MSINLSNGSLTNMRNTYNTIAEAIKRTPKNKLLHGKVSTLARSIIAFHKENSGILREDPGFKAEVDALREDIGMLLRSVLKEMATSRPAGVASSSNTPSPSETTFVSLKEKVPENIREIIRNNLYQIECLDQYSLKNGENTCGFHSLKNALCALALAKGHSIKNGFQDKNTYRKVEDLACAVRGATAECDATEVNLRDAWKTIVDKKHLLFSDEKNELNWDSGDLSFFHVSDNAPLDRKSLMTTDAESLRSLINLKDLSKREGPCQHAFIVGDTGHWFTLIYEKNALNEVTWYGIDSGGNKQDQLQRGIECVIDAMETLQTTSASLYSHSIGEELENRYKLIGSNHQLLDKKNENIFIDAEGKGSLIPQLKEALNFLSRMEWLVNPPTPQTLFLVSPIKGILEYYKKQKIQNPDIDVMLTQISLVNLSDNDFRVHQLALHFEQHECDKEATAILKALPEDKLDYALAKLAELQKFQDVIHIPFEQSLACSETVFSILVNLINILPLNSAKDGPSIKEHYGIVLQTHVEELDRAVTNIIRRMHDIKDPKLARALAMAVRSMESIFRFPLDPNAPISQPAVDEMYELARGIIKLTNEKRINRTSNPYTVVKRHQEVRNEQTPVHILCVVDGKRVIYNFGQTVPKLTRADIPSGVSLELLEDLFQKIKEKIQSPDEQANSELKSYILQGRYMWHDFTATGDPTALQGVEPDLENISFEGLYNNFMRDGTILGLFELPAGPNREISTIQYQFFTVLKNLFEQSSEVVQGEKLSPQERMLLNYTRTILNCKSGKKQGIEEVYRLVPETNKELGQIHDNEEMIKKFTRNFFHDKITAVLRNQTFIKSLLGMSPNQELEQPSHFVDFIQNRFGKLLGLTDDISFDFYTHHLTTSLHSTSNEQFLKKFIEFYKPNEVIEQYTTALKEMLSHIIKKPKNEKSEMEQSLYTYLQELMESSEIALQEAFQMDEDEFNFIGVTDLGAKTVRDSLHVIETPKNLLDNTSLVNKSALEIKELILQSEYVNTLDLTNCTQLSLFDIISIIETSTHLETLNLTGCTQLTNEGLTQILERKIPTIDLSHCIQLTEIKTSEKYTKLVLNGCSGITSINCFGNSEISDADVLGLTAECPNLTSINLGACPQITDAAIQGIAAKYPKLTTINLVFCKQVTDAAFIELAESCPELTQIYFAHCEISDTALIKFAENCPNLTGVYLAFCKITDAAVIKFAENCSELTKIHLSNIENVTDASIIKLARNCSKLTKIYLADSDKITDAAIIELTENCPRLTKIWLSGCTNITSAVAEAVKKLE